MLRRLFPLIVAVLFISSCKKENDNPQWDIGVIGPLLHASLGMEQLIGDTSIENLSDGAQILNYDTTFSQFDIDSLFQISDTSFPTYVLFPAIPSTIPPNQTFLSSNNTMALGVGDVKLREAIIASGKIRIDIKNTLGGRINFTYTINGAEKDGQVFSVLASVAAGSTASPSYFSSEYDMTGYHINLTGSSGNLFNTITYDVQAVSDPNGTPFNVGASDTIVNLNTTLIGVTPSFVRGYLGQTESQTNDERNSGIGQLITGGMIALDSVKLNFDIINYIGADAQAYISSLSSRNTHTGNSVGLVAPSFLQRSLNINRASINPSLPDSLVSTTYTSVMDHTNSNIRQFIENLPDKFDFDLKLNLNPLGNVSGNNDFVFSDRLLSTRIRLRMPLKFGANQLTLQDTVDFLISDASSLDPINPVFHLTMIADNGFPFDMNMQLFLLDSATNVAVDSILVPDFIKSAPIDVNYRAIGFERTKIDIPVDGDRKEKLIHVKRMGIRIRFNTPDYPQLVQMYSNYRLNLKLVADGTYSIR